MNTILKIFVLSLICLISGIYNSFSQKSALSISEPYGPYSIGFKVNHTYDKSRSFAWDSGALNTDTEKTVFRPMQICIWYPAESSTQEPMRYRDYFFLKAHETGEVVMNKAREQQVIDEFLETDPVDKDILNLELSAAMKAVKNAIPIRNEKYPLIIYGPSWWSTAFENALLCEFLASHGYVVISSPSMGPVNREMPISRIGVETQARDMEFLLSQVGKLPNADKDKLAVAGFSLGGLSNVLMLARNTSVDAWVGLDPSIHEAYEFFAESPYEDYSRFTKPALFINSAGYMNDLPFYDKLIYSDAYVVNLPELEHTDLASLFIKIYAGRDEENFGKRVYGYNLTARYALDFLDGTLKEQLTYEDLVETLFTEADLDSSFVKFKSKKGIPVVDRLFDQFKKSKANGIVQFLDSLMARDNISYPESDLQKLIFLSDQNRFNESSRELMQWYAENYPDSFHQKVLGYREFDQMLRMFIAVYTKNKSCHFTYEELNHTAHVLSMSGDGEEAIDFFSLNTELYPTEARAFFNLGLGYFRIEDSENAAINFRKCLELNPDDRYKGLALDFLEKLP